MAIKFSCPHCQKAFQNVKDELAGQKRKCPGCQKIFTIPAPVGAPADIEEFAAAAFSDQPETVEEAPPPTLIDFVCDYCDEKVQVAIELAGKQTSCPHCRRIVKVPLLEKETKDWRNVKTRIPSAARRDVGPVPDGLWDTGAAVGVSAKSLMDAQALANEREPATWGDWARRGAIAAGGLAVVGLVSVVVVHFMTLNQESRALAKALEYVDRNNKADPQVAAVVLQAAGDYHLRASKITNNLQNATDRYARARLTIAEMPGDRVSAHDLLLIDLALAQIERGGKEHLTQRQERESWDKTFKEIERTLVQLRSPEGRMEGLSAVTRKLLEKGQGSAAAALGSSLFPDEAPQALAVVGLEMARAKQKKEAERLAEQAQKLYKEQRAKQTDKKGEKGEKKTSGPPTELIALWLVLEKEGNANALAPPSAGNQGADPLTIIGYADGLARQGDLAAAHKRAKDARLPADRIKALIAIAPGAADKPPPFGGATAVKEILDPLRKELKETPASSWMLLRLVQNAIRTGLATEVDDIIPMINDPDLRGRAKLEVLRFRLASMASMQKEVDDMGMLDMVDKGALDFGLAHELIARHNARLGGPGFRKTVEGWQTDKLRALGNIGIALGLQDRATKEKP